LVYDGPVGAGKMAIGHVLKFNKMTDRYLIRFDDGRLISMEEEEVERKVLMTKGITILEEESISGEGRAEGKNRDQMERR
jgi:hypothetical protein